MGFLTNAFLTSDRIETALDEIAYLVKEQGARVALAGGVAAQLFGSDVLTADIDILAEERIDGLEEIEDGDLQMLTFGGYPAITPSGVPVDVIIRDDKYQRLYEEGMDAAVKISGVPLKVVPGEYVLVMKFQAGRDKDVVGVERLIAGGKLDLDKIRKIMRKYLGEYAVDEFDQVVQVLEWQKTKPNARVRTGRRRR